MATGRASSALNCRGQQGLATAQAIAPLMMQGYQQGVQTAAGQQAVVAQDLQRQLAAGQQLGGLGAQAQQTALAGAQAQLGAGTAEQQTEQAGKQALYNQFLQERGYPFQVAQFLANIAMGTGALSGSTTTTNQMAPFFSDEREKTNVQPLGEGLYAYDYIDDVRRAEEEGRPMPPKRVGPMAQDIEERAPGLVGEVAGHKVVGMNSMGGLVSDPGAYASGGSVVGSEDMKAILAAVGQPLAFYGGKGMYGGADKGGVGAAGYVSPASIPVPKLVTAGGLPAQRASGFEQALDTGSKIAGLAKTGKSALVGSEATSQSAASRGLIGSGGEFNKKGFLSGLGGGDANRPNAPMTLAGGLNAVDAIGRDPSLDLDQLGTRTSRAGGGALPYSTGNVGEDPLQKIGDDGDQKYEMMKPGNLPQTGPGAGEKLLDLGMKAAAIFAASDARMKDNIEQVGELYDGQPVYRYNMKGSPKTQIGLMAQDLEHNGHGDAVAGLGGIKMVDYKRATDVAAGLAPRQGYQSGGSPDFIEGPAIDFERLQAPPPPRDERKYTPEALRGLVREYGQELRGRRPNFDPAFAERVFEGESGFDPRAVGDDGSSFGVPQLHMGNISPKFPRPGLGDEFMRDTGLDPRDPKNSRAMTAWAMDHAAEKGWQPWTVARQLRAQGDTDGASAPGLGGGRRETAERVTPGLAGPGRGPMDPASAPFYTLTRRALGMEGEGTPTQKALTSENFWVPALAGVGSMLASRSPFFGVALGEGLMGGTKAYTDLQSQQQQMGESRARTEQTVANISGGALQVVDGRLMVRYLRPDGSYDLVEYSKIRNLPPEERARYRVDPRDLEQAEKLLGASAGPVARAPAAAPAAEPPVAMPRGEPVSSTAPPAPPAGRMPHEAAPPASPVSRPTTVGGIGLTPEQVAQARAITQERSGFPQAEREKQPDLFTPQYELARQSENAKGQVIPLVGALAGLPRDKSPLASGPVQAIAAPIAGVVNNLASILGVNLPFDIQNPRALQEEIDKLGTRLNLQSASSAQQRAFAALQEISKGIPTYLNSPGGQAKLIPTLLVETQREIDRQNFFRSWENAAAGERGQNAEYARLSSRDANEAFEKEFTNAVAAKERTALEKMFNERFPITDPKTGQRRNISAMEYVVEFGGEMTPEQKQRFRDRFGAGLKYDPLRYFGVN